MSNAGPAASSPNERIIGLPAKVVVTLRAGALLALANVLCALIVAWAWMSVRTEPKVISVTGSAKKIIQSDRIIWSGRISVNNPDMAAGYDELKNAIAKTLDYLRKEGIDDQAITVAAIATQKHYGRDEKGRTTDKVSSFELVQTIQ